MRSILFGLLAIILLNPTTGFATDITPTPLEVVRHAEGAFPNATPETVNTGVYVGTVPVHGGGSVVIRLPNGQLWMG